MPAPVIFEGCRLPASYANFYIANGIVLAPTFNDPHDRHALNTLAELFPRRQVVGIHCVDLVLGLGTLHCLSHEQPAACRAVPAEPVEEWSEPPPAAVHGSEDAGLST
jgi:agmatine deiminase